MEPLQQAIARARAERSGEIGNVPDFDQIQPLWASEDQSAQASPEPSSPIDSPSERQRARSGTSLNNIVYTRTRVETLDPVVLEKRRVIAGLHDDRRVETYRQLRTQVMQTFEQQGWTKLAITSPQENAGKTLTAVNLAISLSHAVNHTVLLVDLDLRKPEIHLTLGVDVEQGLVDVVRGEAAVEDVLFNPGMPRLVVLPGRALGQYSSELLSSPGMENLLHDISQRYDSRLVIFDLPPLLRNDDAMLFIPYVDTTLLVVEDGKNTPDEIEHCLRLMKNVNLLGTILNKAREV